MKTRLAVLSLSFLALAVIAQEPALTNVVVVGDVSTNTVATTNVVNLPPAFEQVANLLGPKFKEILTQVTIWIGSLSLIIAPFAGRLGRWLRDRINQIAEGKAIGTDVWLRKLFDNIIYQTISTALRFINIDFPTTEELDRAVKLQAEAVAEARKVTVGGIP